MQKEKEQGTARAMTWEVLITGAKLLGDEYKEFLENIGRDAVMRVMQTGRAIYSESVQMDPDEAALAAYRYFSATMDRVPNDLERDKLMELFFMLYWNKGRIMSELQVLTMGADGALPGLASVESIEKMLEKIGFPQMLNKQDSDDFSANYKNGAAILQYLYDVADVMTRLRAALIEIKTDLRSVNVGKKPVDKDRITALEKRLKSTNDKIELLEKELNIKVKHGENSAADDLNRVRAKIERFAAAHSGLFKVRCECGYYGPINRRQPPDSPIDILHPRWGWECPGCKQMMALDRKHPFFDGKVAWSHRAWELVEKGDRFTILDMAYILGMSPEGIMWVAQKSYNKNIPEHVQEDFDEYERAYLQNSNQGVSPEDEVPDVEGPGEE